MEGRTSCWKTASVSLADHSRCPGQLSQRVRIQRIPRLPQEADPMLQVLPPTAQRFANDKCPVGAPPLSPRLSRWNLVNPPPTHPEKGGFCGVPEQWGPGPHTVEETPSAPALSPDLADDVSPHRGRAALSPAPPSRKKLLFQGHWGWGRSSDAQVLFCHRGPACRLWPPSCQHCLNR